MTRRRMSVTLRTYPIIEEAVARGTAYGWHRVAKYLGDDYPPDLESRLREQVVEQVTAAVMLELDGIVEW